MKPQTTPPLNSSLQRPRRTVCAATVVCLAIVAGGCRSDFDAATAPTTTEIPTSLANSLPPRRAPAEAISETELGAIVESHFDQGEFVGARLALLNRDGTVTEAVAGTQSTDLASPPVDPDVPWGIGSITKVFVSVVLLQLADEGRIDLDDGIENFMPAITDAHRITPRQLLQHTSGLGEYLDQVRDDAQHPWTPSELIAVAETAGRVSTPGDAYHYSNTNFIVLGEIIGQVTGAPWFDAVRARIIEPLGMTRTGLIDSDAAPGYDPVPGGFLALERWDPTVGGAAGALQATSRDLLRFVEALSDGILLSTQSQVAMETFIPGDDLSEFDIVHSAGLGLESYQTPTITVYGHLGSGDGHSAFIGYDTENGTAIAVSVNSQLPGPQAIMAIEALTAAS